jgi:hypothetical protein
MTPIMAYLTLIGLAQDLETIEGYAKAVISRIGPEGIERCFL